MAEDARLGLVSSPSRADPVGQPAQPDPAAAALPLAPEAVSARVGTFGPADLARGADISAQLPEALRRLASQPSTAGDLVLALMLDTDPAVRDRQLALTGPGARRLCDQVAGLPEVLRLPLIGIAMPLVAARPPDQVQGFVTTADQLAQADGSYSLFEYCAVRLIGSYLRDSLRPHARSAPGRTDVRQLQQAALTLLAAVAAAGNPDPAAAAHAFGAGAARLLPGQSLPAFEPPPSVFALDAGWQPLDSLDPQHKRALVEALVAAVRDDGVLNVAEAELLRTACAMLHCPLPVSLS